MERESKAANPSNSQGSSTWAPRSTATCIGRTTKDSTPTRATSNPTSSTATVPSPLAVGCSRAGSRRADSSLKATPNDSNVIFSMAMNLNLKLKSEYKEQPIKSPRHMTPECNKKPPRAEASELKTFIRGYRKEVELPINFETSIFLSKTPQRCLQHNNVITLYCVNDKRPLCAHCMYQVIAHGKHEVVPLAKASTALREQLGCTIRDINTRLLPSMTQLIAKSQANLELLEKEMTELMQKVDKSYSEVIGNITAKRDEQISQYQGTWNRLRHEYSTFTSELTRINQYMNEKIKDISQRSTDQNLLYFHNVAMYLHKMDQIIEPPFCEYQALRVRELGAKMEELGSTVRGALAFPIALTKQQAVPSIIVQKQASQSLKKDKMSWMLKKNEGSTLHQKSIKKLPSPRSPLLAKNPATLREAHPSPKKETSYKFFHKDKSLKDRLNLQGRLKNRKSETNMFRDR